MKRLLALLSVILPAAWMLVSWIAPELDPVWRQPILHFYLVTFFTFTAVVVAFFIKNTLGEEGEPRHRLLVTAYVAMAAIFFVHGVTTPGAIITSINPGIRWAAWLTLFIGGLLFALASFDTPAHSLSTANVRRINWFIAIFVLLFMLVVAFVPEWLAAIDNAADPFHEQLAFWMTMVLWVYGAVRLGQIWRDTGDQVDGLMALIGIWFVLGTVSLHQFAGWSLSWWLYHFYLLGSALLITFTLASKYEQIRRFRLTRYYAALSLVATAGLALLAAHFFSRVVEFVTEMPDLATSVPFARLMGLLIAGGSMGSLFLVLLILVRRADQLITARNNELTKAYHDLQVAEAGRDDLTDMIVHDLRSPLTAINLNLKLLEESLDDPSRQMFRERFITNAGHSVGRMLQLINDLLDVAKLEAGQLVLVKTAVDVGDLLRQKADFFTVQAEDDQKRLDVFIAKELPLVTADPDLLGRVLDNLISNALKYTEMKGTVSLSAELKNSAVEISISDDGLGIPEEQLKSIFEKFVQVTDDDGRPFRVGTGLGLPFCKMVIQAHKGRIWVESVLGQGSTFKFTLPL